MMGRILLVDDEDPIRNMLKRLILRRLPGVEVVEATSAEEAMDAARKSDFAVVLTDFRMAGATGADLLRDVATMSPGTARVLATGYQEEKLVEDALVGVALDARLPKPWDNDEVIQLLTRLLQSRNKSDAIPNAGGTSGAALSE